MARSALISTVSVLAAASADAFVAPSLAPRGLARTSAAASRAPALRAPLRKGRRAALGELMSAATEAEVDYNMVTAITLRNVAIIAHVDHGKTTLVGDFHCRGRVPPRPRQREPCKL
jgi:hypothetical protein